jgi:hypothetical protein
MIGCLCVRVGVRCGMSASSCMPVHACPWAQSVHIWRMQTSAYVDVGAGVGVSVGEGVGLDVGAGVGVSVGAGVGLHAQTACSMLPLPCAPPFR